MAKKDDEQGKSATTKSVRSNGHTSSGGHVGSHNAIRQNSAFSRTNRLRWNHFDGITGDSMPYQYQEYPKHIYPTPGNHKHFIVVQSAEEEKAFLKGEEIIDVEHEHKRLLAVAKVKGVQVDKRWGPAKLTKAIEDAGHDPTLDPFN